MQTPSRIPRRSFTTSLGAACAAFALAAGAPHASAGEADGIYRMQRISASDGLPVTESLVADAIGSDNRITVTDNTIRIRREKWLDVLNQFNFVFSGGTAKFSGPRSITLEPSGDSYVGRTRKPVSIKLTGSFLGTEIRMDLRTSCRAKITGNRMVLVLPVRVSTDGETNASGTVRVVARKM